MSSFSKDSTNGGCLEHAKFVNTIQIVLDGEACRETEEKFLRHISVCASCFDLYHLDKALKELIQNKIQKKSVPSSLLQSVRDSIFIINQTA